MADDITGATDLAGSLVSRGLITTQIFGQPGRLPPPDSAAIVIALKTRTGPSEVACRQSVECLHWLQGAGFRHIFFKYCSTFDSTPMGNIGPVTDALLAHSDASQTLHCPSYPRNGRTVYLGHLFVDQALLAESGMQHHPVNPMTDSNLVRVLQAQTRNRVGLLPLGVVKAGTASVTSRLSQLLDEGIVHVMADAVDDADLNVLAQAASQLPLSAGGAAFGAAIGAALSGVITTNAPVAWQPPRGWSAVLVGSASKASTDQVRAFAAHAPLLLLTAEELARGANTVNSTLAWARERLSAGPVLIAADTAPYAIQRAQAALGQDGAAHAVERGLAAIAVDLVAAGVRRLIVAGGETSGAVANALELHSASVGPEICTGVPWTFSDDPELALAFKSGNFGGDDFFQDAFDLLERVGRGTPS